MPLNQVATISVPEPRLISVQVWDKSMVHAVEKAIAASDLGLTPSTEGQVLRLRIPELNEERRKELSRSRTNTPRRTRCRAARRRDGLDVLKRLEKDHKISERRGKRSSEKCRRRRMKPSPRSTKCWPTRKKEILTVVRFTGCRRAAAAHCQIGDFRRPARAIIMDATDAGQRRADAAREGIGGVEALRRTVRAAAISNRLSHQSFLQPEWRPPHEIRS